MSSQRQLFLKHIAQTSDSPMGLEIVGGEGRYLIDRSGKRYLDLICGIGPSILGHNHPAIVSAVKDQAGQFMHTLVYGEMVLSPQVTLAEKLTALLPPSLDNVYLTSTGTEATEGAMKLAKRSTGRYIICAFREAYHGSTQGAMSLMSDSYFTGPYRPLVPGVKFLQFADEGEFEHITVDTAAVIIETVRAESGIHKPSQGYLKKLRNRCTEVGALLILDEIQAGYGRTGSMFAFTQYDVVPDILLLGKGFGGGMPLGAFVASQELMQNLSHDPVLGHITTYGGHPVCCAAGIAVLDTLSSMDLIQQVPAKEKIYVQRLQHPLIRSVRSAGLWLAVELSSFDEVRAVICHCIDLGLITDWFLFNDRCLRICPPLNIEESEIHESIDILLESMDRVKASMPS